MKKFLEEYGFAILAAIVVIILIAMCTPVGSLIKKQVMNVVNNFALKTESRLDNVDNTISVIINQTDVSKIEVKVISKSTTDEFNVEYRVKVGNNAWGEYKSLDPLKDPSSKMHKAEYTIEANDGNQIQVRVTDPNRKEKIYYESNLITYLATFVPSGTEGGEEEPQLEKKPVGGVIYYDNGDNGAIYTFYDADNNVISGNPVGNTNIKYYSVTGTSSADRYYVYAAKDDGSIKGSWPGRYWTYRDSSGWKGENIGVSSRDTAVVGSGKSDTEIMLSYDNGAYVKSAADMGQSYDTVWYYINEQRINNLNGCNDWFIGSYADIQKLADYDSSLLRNSAFWSSSQSGVGYAWYWIGELERWNYYAKSLDFYVFPIRAF